MNQKYKKTSLRKLNRMTWYPDFNQYVSIKGIPKSINFEEIGKEGEKYHEYSSSFL
jgi:hypothetical protein